MIPTVGEAEESAQVAPRSESAARQELRLTLEGMTCAACAARIERALNKLKGVEATVNYATEQAAVSCEPSVTLDELIAAVDSVGYRACPAAAVKPGVAGGEQPERDRRDAQLVILRRRLIAAIALSIPVAVLAMASPLQFARWQWLALALATPVVFWSGAASTVPP